MALPHLLQLSPSLPTLAGCQSRDDQQHAVRNVQRAVDVRGFAGEAREHAPDSSGDYAAGFFVFDIAARRGWGKLTDCLG